jgi:transcriptional regulator, TetR family
VITHKTIIQEVIIYEEKEESKDAIQDYLFNEALPEEELTKRQWQILDAATKVFAEKGYEASRTSDIAKEADIAEGTIFRYFKTKRTYC